MRLKANRNGVQIACWTPNGGHGTFPLFARGRPLHSLRGIPKRVRAARAWEKRAEIL
jgi:hypothetical protein